MWLRAPYDIRATILGVLFIREPYFLGVYMRRSLFRKPPYCRNKASNVCIGGIMAFGAECDIVYIMILLFGLLVVQLGSCVFRILTHGISAFQANQENQNEQPSRVCVSFGGPILRRAHGLHTRETYPKTYPETYPPETYPVTYPRNCR